MGRSGVISMESNLSKLKSCKTTCCFLALLFLEMYVPLCCSARQQCHHWTTFGSDAFTDASFSTIWKGILYLRTAFKTRVVYGSNTHFKKKGERKDSMTNTSLPSIKSTVTLISPTCTSCPKATYTVFLWMCDPENVSGKVYDAHKKDQFCWLHVLHCQWCITDSPPFKSGNISCLSTHKSSTQ